MLFTVGDIVTMKKPHPCGKNEWKIIRIGADFKLICLGCEHLIMLPRSKFEKRFKKFIHKVID